MTKKSAIEEARMAFKEYDERVAKKKLSISDEQYNKFKKTLDKHEELYKWLKDA